MKYIKKYTYISDFILLLVTENTSSPIKTDNSSIGAVIGGIAVLLVLTSIAVVFARKRKLVGKEEKVLTIDEGKYQFAQLFFYIVVLSKSIF